MSGSVQRGKRPAQPSVATFFRRHQGYATSSKSSVVVVAPSSSPSRLWACQMCTYLNRKSDAPVCELCGTERLLDGHAVKSVAPKAAQAGVLPAAHPGVPDSRGKVTELLPLHQQATTSVGMKASLAPHAARPTSSNKRRRVVPIGSFAGALIPPKMHVDRFSTVPLPNPDLDGLYIVHDFISKAAEARLVRWLDSDRSNPWSPSKFNGKHLSKGWGVRTDLATGTTRPPVDGEPAFPPPSGELDEIVAKLRTVDFARLVKTAKGWAPNEANANLYEQHRGHYLGAHFDHRAVSGPVLATMSLAGDAFMTFNGPKGTAPVKVDLPRRSIQLVCRTARYNWTHEIRHDDLRSHRRISMTFRMAKLS